MLLLSVGIVAIMAAPEGGHWAGSWSSIRATAARVAGVEAEFVQRKQMPVLTRPLESRGRFTFQSSGHLRWEYQSPVKSLLELKEGRVRRYLWEGGRFRVDGRQRPDAMLVVLGEITLWLSGKFQASENFRATLTPGMQPRMVLTPLKPALARFIKKIVLVPGLEAGAIGQVIISEAGDATTTIEFTRTRMRYH